MYNPLPEEVLATLREDVPDGEGLVLGAGLCSLCWALAYAHMQSQRCRGACNRTAQQLRWGTEHPPTCARR